MSDERNASTAGATCLLLVGDRVMLRATAPPEAEYALFEIGEIELRASEPGRVREHGYQTTVELARTRLHNVGLTASVARDFASAMQPVLSDAYARGPAVRRVARYLGPMELFQSEGYDGSTHTYRGVFLDLAALTRDLQLDHAGATLHALYLATVLESEPDEGTVLLSTDACTKGGKPGARTYKRPTFTDPQRLLNALGGLAHRGPKPDVHEILPRADVIAFLRVRADSAQDEDARDLYRSLEGSVALRDMPEKGPLAAPDLWAIETRIDSGELEGVVDAIDDAERRHGRTPGTTYLRARAALLLRLEAPKLVAERVSALALSMTSFQELGLLAAEAWLEADDPKRAMPYARDLVDSPGIDEGLLLRAQRLLARAVGAAPQKKTLVDSIPAAQPTRPLAMFEGLPPQEVRDIAMLASAAVPPSSASDSEPIPQSLEPEDLVPLDAPPPPFPSAPTPLPPPPRPSRRIPPPVPSSRPSSSMREAPRLDAPRARPSAPSRAAPPLPSGRSIPVAAPAKGGDLFDREPSSIPLTREPDLFGATSGDAFPDLEASAGAAPLSPPGPLPLEVPALDPAASFTLDLPGPETLTPEPAPRPSRRPRLSGVMMETRPPASYDPRAEPDSPIVPRRSSAQEIPIVPAEIRTQAAPARSHRPPEPSPLPTDRTAHERPTPLRPSAPTAAAAPTSRASGSLPRPMEPSIAPPRESEALAFLPGEADHPDAPSLPRPMEPSVRPPATTPVFEADEGLLLGATEIELGSSIPVPSPARSFMHGASLPPFRLENPPPLLPKAPLLPRLAGAVDELAEHLQLPPGLAEPRSLDVLPTSVLEARVQFTFLARELGLDYRLKRAIDLRADVSGIEAMQSVLLESFPDHAVRTADEAYELRRHGALLSEILARRLDAEWLDISPNELGYWVMIVPPDTRVWPFGRVARLVAMGHKERDLVSYFFELQSRARGR